MASQFLAARPISLAIQRHACVHSGMELKDAEARMLRLGRPASIEYRSGQLDVTGTDSGCILDLDPATNRIVGISVSGAPLFE